MGDTIVAVIGGIFALVAGTAAGTLSGLGWVLLRESPFGRAALTLSAALVAFVVYHAFTIVAPDTLLVAKVLKSAVFTATTLLVWILVWEQRRVKRVITGEEVTDG